MSAFVSLLDLEKSVSKLFTKISLVFYILLTIFFIPYFSIYSLTLFSSIIITILLFKLTNSRLLTFLRVPFLIGSIFIIYSEYGSWRGFEPASILFSTLVLLKMFELKTKRDIYSLILIQFLHVTSLSLLVEDFYYLFIIFISLLVCFCNLYLVQQVNVEKLVFRKSIKNILRFSLFGAPLVVILFLSFPRINFGGFLFSTSKATTGFSEELSPGDISEIIKDPSAVFHVKFTKRIKRLDMYWRGQILAKNKLFSWEKSKLPEKRNTEKIFKKFDYFVTYDTLTSGPLFTLEKTRKVALSSMGSLINLKGNLYRSNTFRNQKSRYKGWLGPDLPAKLLDNYKDVYLQTDLPADSEVIKYRDSHLSLVNKPTLVAKHLKSFFRSSFTYSTSPGVYKSKNPLDEFLFRRKVGFCGHYASASATLFRLFGIPSRVVLGYQGGIFNEVGTFYVVTEKDAHAWVEYLDENGIWTRFDAVSVVSPARIMYGADTFFEFEKLGSRDTDIEDFVSSRSGILSDWKQYIQNIYYKTGTLFFNYDLETQRNLFKKFVSFKHTSSLFFYFPYLILCLLLVLVLFLREKIKSFLLFICVNKYRSLKWSNYTVLTEPQLIELIEDSSSNLVELILVYQRLRYSRNESAFKELSFFFKAFKILIYG